MSKPSEIDSPEAIRDALINQRNTALGLADFENAVLLSHAIAWMGYLIELMQEQETKDGTEPESSDMGGTVQEREVRSDPGEHGSTSSGDCEPERESLPDGGGEPDSEQRGSNQGEESNLGVITLRYLCGHKEELPARSPEEAEWFTAYFPKNLLGENRIPDFCEKCSSSVQQ